MNLFEIFVETVSAVSDLNRHWMEAQGVSRDVLWRGPAAFGAARIQINGQTFQFNGDGDPAVIMPVSNSYEFDLFEDGIVDLLAFLPSDPSQWWLLRNVAPILNPEAAQRAVPVLDIDEVLVVHDTPMAWLQAGQEGIVILDWSKALPLWLHGVHRILADNPDLARRIHVALEAPSTAMPDIRSREVRHAA